MLITCPSCLADYDVPGPIAAGRNVKCAKCGAKWQPVLLPPEPEWEPEPEPPPEPEPAFVPPPEEPVATIKPPDPPPPKPKRNGLKGPSLLAIAWVFSGLLLAGLIAAGIVFRAPLMDLWPPSQRLYGWLHLR